MPEDLDVAIARLAARQHAVFSRAQALERGATSRVIQHRLATGRWDRMHPGVYRIPGSQPTWHQALLGGVLALGPTVAVSHRAAAALWSLPGFERRVVELSVPRGRDADVEGATMHRPRELPAVDITVRYSIPVTTPERTLIDLAGVVTIEVLEEAFDDALRRWLVSLPRLRWRLQKIGGKGRKGAGALSRLVDARGRAGAVSQNVFERKVSRLLREASLPEPILQHEIRRGGRLIARVDFAYPKLKIAIEADGYRWHTGRARFDADLARRNAVTAEGWHVIHITWTDLTERPGGVVEMISAAVRTISATTRSGGAAGASGAPDEPGRRTAAANRESPWSFREE